MTNAEKKLATIEDFLTNHYSEGEYTAAELAELLDHVCALLETEDGTLVGGVA